MCWLKWEYEVNVAELATLVFIIPGGQVKNGEERLVVLNGIAKSVIDNLRGLHPVPQGFRNVRVHDLKHTFGQRLRAAGVSFEDRQDLLGHRQWSHHDALLQSRTDQLDRGRRQGLRHRVPQKSRNHLASAQVKLATEALTD